MKHTLRFLALGLLILLASQAHAVPIYNPGTLNYYDVIPGAFTWGASKTGAESMFFNGYQGHLAAITSAAENEFVRLLLVNQLGGGPAWLGGYQFDKLAEPAGNWTWVTGETFAYTNWKAGEPNNSNNNEDHLHMTGGDGLWNDAPGNITQIAYVVEYATPEPATMFLLGSGLVGLAGVRRKKLKI